MTSVSKTQVDRLGDRLRSGTTGMLFLIEYDRRKGLIVELREFDNGAREVAEDARLDLELRLNRQGIEDEVVILDAPSREALQHTHGRYFQSLAELARGSAEVQAQLM